MKKIYSICIFLISTSSIYSQSNYYWYDNEKIFLNRNLTKKFIQFENITDTNDLKAQLNIPGLKVPIFHKEQSVLNVRSKDHQQVHREDWAIIMSDTPISKARSDNIIYEAPFYYTLQNEELGLSNLFYVRLRSMDDFDKLEVLANVNGVEVLGQNIYNPLLYTLSCNKNSQGNALEMANLFYETGLFKYTEPDLMVDDWTSCVNDTYFDDQWGLYNDGQYDGTAGVDINICQAWQTTNGDPDITIAILDEGIEPNHPDLQNIAHCWDTETGISSCEIYDAHGMAVAGIIGATNNNNKGIAGVAPECQLMILSNDLIIEQDTKQELANGIRHAWENGADIINNSWGTNALESSAIREEIENAMTYGRNGLGCVVVCATGNYESSEVNFPANVNEDIIAVGAISQCGEYTSEESCDTEDAWGSNFGDDLDIMAPGVLIATLDKQGDIGINPDRELHTGNGGYLIYDDYPDQDYTVWFMGTSAACPFVSGVAGLILSVNPCLTHYQVTDIIESTAQKTGEVEHDYDYDTEEGRLNGTWYIKMGYGVVDAGAAVAQTLVQNTIISNITFTEDITLSNCLNNIELDNVTITNNADVEIMPANSVFINGPFDVNIGSTLHIQ